MLLFHSNPLYDVLYVIIVYDYSYEVLYYPLVHFSPSQSDDGQQPITYDVSLYRIICSARRKRVITTATMLVILFIVLYLYCSNLSSKTAATVCMHVTSVLMHMCVLNYNFSYRFSCVIYTVYKYFKQNVVSLHYQYIYCIT